MVEVFKTDIKKRSQSKTLVKKLQQHYPESCINFDLEDCDNILRVEGEDICPHTIIQLLISDGYCCQLLQ